MYMCMYIYIYIYIISFQGTESGAGGRFLPRECRAKADTQMMPYTGKLKLSCDVIVVSHFPHQMIVFE